MDNPIHFQPDWPETWKHSYLYDLLEIYDCPGDRGYSYAYNIRARNTFQLIHKVAKPKARILDVAAAQGNFTLALAKMGYCMTWNDLREDLIGYVQRKHECGTIHYAPGNIFDLQFEEPFDIILVAEVIEHVAHPDEFLKKIAQLVKLNGHIILTTPNGGYFLNQLPKFSVCEDPSQFEDKQFKLNAGGHIFLLYPEEMESLSKQAGLSVLEKRLFTNPLTNGHLKTERLLKVLPRKIVHSFEQMTQYLPQFSCDKLWVGMAVLLKREH